MQIKIDNLSKAYGSKTVLSDQSFCFEEGINCIMAPSGRGKTTLLRLILGLEKPDAGSVNGADRLRWGVAFQEDRLIETMDARNNLSMVLGAEFSADKAKEVLAELGLDLEDAKPVCEYSGGMKRRLALARALLRDCDAFIFDEPFSGLDADIKAKTVLCLKRMTEGKPVLLVTHAEEDAEALNAKVFRL